MALEIKQNLPVSVIQLLSDGWKGGPLIQLEDSLSTAKADDLILNFPWIKPVAAKFRDRIPSGFFLADVFLYMDRMWLGKLLYPQEDETKADLAGYEAKKVKALLSTLRALWRSSTLAFYGYTCKATICFTTK